MVSKRVQWPIFKLPPISHLPDNHVNDHLKNMFGLKSLSEKLEYFDTHLGRLLLNDGVYNSGSGVFSCLHKFYDPENRKQRATYEGFRRNKFEELNEKIRNMNFQDKLNTVLTYDLKYNLEQNEIFLDKDNKITVEPAGPEQILIFNEVIKIHLSKADEGGTEYNRYKNRVFSSDYNIKKFSQKLMDETTSKNKIDLIDHQVNAILRTFQFPNEYFTERTRIELSDYFIFNGNGANDSDLFNFVLGNNKVDYTSHVISVGDHIKILHTENIIAYYKWLLKEKESVVNAPSAKPGPRNTANILSPKTQNQVIALFCTLLNESGLLKKEPWESNGKYCERICKEFEFNYTEKVRQLFGLKRTNRNNEKLKLAIQSKDQHPIYSQLLEYMESKK
jgi:hypothetical protein